MSTAEPRPGSAAGLRDPARRGGWRVAALLLLCAALFTWRLGRPALSDPDEGRNAEVAREMLTTGDFVTPHIDGARYLDKPPAYFWVVAAALRLGGVNELAARVPSALFASLTVLVLFAFVRRRLGPRAALLAGAVLALTPLYIVFARTVIFDMMLTFCMTLSGLAAFEALEPEGRVGASDSRRRLAGLLFFVAAGVGTITKGPVALVAPLLVAMVWVLLERRAAASVRRLGLGWGLALYATIVLPWLLVISARNPGYLGYALVSENLQRVATDRFETAEPVYWYLGIVLPGFFPWIIYAAAARARGAGVAAAGARVAAIERYATIWFGALFVFFSLVRSKRPSYMLPLAVPIALLVACLDVRLENARARAAGDGAADGSTEAAGGEGARKALSSAAWVIATACLLLAAALLLAGPGGLLIGLKGGKYDALLARNALFGLTAAGLAAAAIPIIATRRGRRPIAAFLSGAAAVAVMVPLARAAIGHVDATRSSRTVSRFLLERLRPEDVVVCFDEYRPGLNFYLQRPVDLVTEPGRIFTSNYIKMHLREFQADPEFRLIPVERLRERLRAGPGAYIVAPRRAYADLRTQVGRPLRMIYEDAYGGVFIGADGV